MSSNKKCLFLLHSVTGRDQWQQPSANLEAVESRQRCLYIPLDR